jgi:hypothetical protein
LFNTINKSWKDVPYKVEKEFQDNKWLTTAGRLTQEQRYKRDHSIFKELKGDIPASKIEEYYNQKDTYYVNVGTHGFYLFGNKNPLKLIDVPRFSASASAGWRARVQYKGSGNYQFTFEMSFRIRTKSEYNIAPIQKGSVTIDKKNANLSCFTKL